MIEYCEMLTNVGDLTEDIYKLLKPKPEKGILHRFLSLFLEGTYVPDISNPGIPTVMVRLTSAIQFPSTGGSIFTTFPLPENKVENAVPEIIKNSKENAFLEEGEGALNDITIENGKHANEMVCSATRHADLEGRNEIKFNVKLSDDIEDIDFEVEHVIPKDEDCKLTSDSGEAILPKENVVEEDPEMIKETIDDVSTGGEGCQDPHCFLSTKGDMLKHHTEEDGSRSITALFDCTAEQKQQNTKVLSEVQVSLLYKEVKKETTSTTSAGQSSAVCRKLQECVDCEYQNKVTLRNKKNGDLITICHVSVFGNPARFCVTCGENKDYCSVACGKNKDCNNERRRRRLLDGVMVRAASGGC